MINEIIFATLASFFFSFLFHVKKENLVFAAIAGGIGWFVYASCIQLGFDSHVSTFFAAMGLATYAEIMARIRKTTVTTFLISGLIPLVPGDGMYQTMLAIVNKQLNDAVRIGISTLAIAGLLALGIMFISTLAKARERKA